MPYSSQEIEVLKTKALALREHHQELFDVVSGVLYHRDPARIGITTDYHDYEVYDPHTGLILPQLPSTSSPEAVAELIHGEFLRWYGDRDSGPLENFKWIGQDIWDAWMAYKKEHPDVSFDQKPAEPAAAPTGLAVRAASFGDTEMLVSLRLAMLKELGELPEGQAERMQTVLREYFLWAVPSGELHAWVAEVDGAVVGTCGLILMTRPPSATNITGREAFLVNQYTAPEHRRQGVGQALLQAAVAFARSVGVGRLYAETSPAAEELFQSAGLALRLGSGPAPQVVELTL